MDSQALLVSKPLGLRLLATLDIDGALVLHPDDRADGRSVMSEIEALCRDRGADFRVVSNRAEAATALHNFRPDIAFVCGWYWLISDETLALAPFYGIHNSLLPKYRGGAPLVWAIMNGEEEVGSTLFRLDGGVDDGPIAHQVRVNLPRTATVADATAAIEAEWEKAFPDLWRGLLAGSVPLREQQGEPTRFPNRKPSQGAIDWSLPAWKIHDFIRAQAAPYPGAFSGQTVFDCSFEKAGFGMPVRCGDGRILHIVPRGQYW